jgi:hypothetical protein
MREPRDPSKTRPRSTLVERALTSIAVVAVLGVLSGCPASDPPAPPPPLSASAKAKLAAADLADGKEDKVVSKCPGCSLRMDGHTDHTTALEGYTVLSCHEACAAALQEDPEAVLGRLP